MKHLNKFKIFENATSKIDAENIITEYGGVDSDEPGYSKIVSTKYGPLFINIRADFGRKNSVIFMRFAIPENIKGKISDANQNSGKWNIWGSSISETLSELNRRLSEVTIRE